ncbi:sec-independent protein translocase protein TatA [Thermosyntropha lipolytica DSM 11003]|uniref:Sec-independent protein translocase protein TatA n=1 Tax=Thermosyntropha lipolytica DSM 11003 TaxID=1123382 RepID=A0A1M5PAM6_9FIRM|nr:Sec-independent protein translocase protein TatB [Thermosyntropha lipolytica]SHG98820.1 sec-independent protein translocase protein TatA [Thermosyntropha lipolytica DSM 11003]
MYGFIGNIGPWELVLILLIALIVVGPGKLPEVARSLGKAINQFQKATSGVKREIEEAIRLDDKPSSAADINVKPGAKKEDEAAEEDVVLKEVGEEAAAENDTRIS